MWDDFVKYFLITLGVMYVVPLLYGFIDVLMRGVE